jgi:hypothetical protein
MKAGPAAGTATATARHCAANPISSILKWGESVSIYKNPTHFHIVIKAFPFRNGLKSCACRRAPKSWLWLTQSTKQMVACSSGALQAWHLVWIRTWICIYLSSLKCLNTCRVHMHTVQSCVTAATSFLLFSSHTSYLILHLSSFITIFLHSLPQRFALSSFFGIPT